MNQERFIICLRAVLREDKQTTKVRVVFDGSAKEDGPSINESLYTGPCLLPCIFNILLRFRLYKIGLISDIQQAFLNIGICDEHKEMTLQLALILCRRA